MKNKKLIDDNEKLDDVIERFDLSESTELGEVAQNIFKNVAGRTNLTNDEICLCLINDLIFKGLKMDNLNPVNGFLELKKSQGGWSVNKMVESVGGMLNNRSGGLIGDGFKNLFKPKN